MDLLAGPPAEAATVGGPAGGPAQALMSPEQAPATVSAMQTNRSAPPATGPGGATDTMSENGRSARAQRAWRAPVLQNGT